MASYSETINRVLSGDFKNATNAEKQAATKEIIQVCSVAASACAFQPIPFIDTILISPIQIVMVQAIGKIHGFELNKKSVLEILSTFGASILAQNIMMAAAKFVPFLGWVVAVSMAYALTYAIGEVADHYFKNGRGVDSEELRDIFKASYKKKKEEKESQNKNTGTIKEKLQAITDAYKSELITEEEYQAKKEDILKNF